MDAPYLRSSQHVVFTKLLTHKCPAHILGSQKSKVLSLKEIAVRNGHFYAVRCLEALGIEDVDEGIVRISLVHYNTEREVEQLVEGLEGL